MNLAYLLLLLILPVSALLARRRNRLQPPRPVTVVENGVTYEGTYKVEQGMVLVLCDAGRRGTPLDGGDPERIAERLLRHLYGLSAAPA